MSSASTGTGRNVRPRTPNLRTKPDWHPGSGLLETTNPNDSSPFFRLPAEIRRMVYSQYFAEITRPSPLHVLYVCRRMYLETTEAFYSSTSVDIPLTYTSTRANQIGQRNTAFVRSVNLCRGSLGKYHSPVELKPLRFRHWFAGVKAWFPNVRQVRLDLRTSTFCQSEVGKDAVIQVLQCLYRIADANGFWKNQIDITVTDWVFTPQEQWTLRERVIGWKFNPRSSRLVYPSKDHSDCPICGGIEVSATNRPAHRARRPPNFKLLPPPVLHLIFAHVAELVQDELTQPLVVRINEHGRVSRKLKDNVSSWWYTKCTSETVPSVAYIYNLYKYKPNVRIVAFNDLITLSRSCWWMHKHVNIFLRITPLLDDIPWVFESPNSAVIFFQSLGSNASSMKPHMRKVALPFLALRETNRRPFFHRLVPPDARRLRHMRIALSHFLALPEITSLSIHSPPASIPSLTFFGLDILQHLTILSEPTIPSAIATAYHLPTPQRRIPLVKLQLTGLKVVKLPYCAVTSYKQRDVSWLLRESLHGRYGYDGSRWRMLDGTWDVRDDAKERAELVLFDEFGTDMMKMYGAEVWEVL